VLRRRERFRREHPPQPPDLEARQAVAFPVKKGGDEMNPSTRGDAESPSTFKVGVCEVHPELAPGTAEWAALCAAVSPQAPDLLLLNEMPFGPWLSAGEAFDEAEWESTLAQHDAALARLPELGARTVAGTRPRRLDGRRINEAFVWTPEAGLVGVHSKQYFPDEAGYYEARWFAGGDRHFALADAAGLRVGFLICTELMFNEHARSYGRAGAQVLLVPRAVGPTSLRRWLVAARMAAIVSGAYVLSSNRAGVDSRGQAFGGAGWIVDPFGDLVAETSSSAPVAFHTLDTALVRQAQREYPCYVKELSRQPETMRTNVGVSS
jgi:N-carbamoylputrescine amidase